MNTKTKPLENVNSIFFKGDPKMLILSFVKLDFD